MRSRRAVVVVVAVSSLLGAACRPSVEVKGTAPAEKNPHKPRSHSPTTTSTTRPRVVTTTTAALPTTAPTTRTTTTTSAPSIVATTVPPTTIAAPPPPPTYAFDDEFNGSTLDLTKWRPNWLAGTDTAITKPVNSLEASCYDPANVSVPGDGYLHLRADARSCLANNGVTYGYASGLVETANHFTFTYGHVEARIWLSGSNRTVDNWPAFWADGTGTWPTTGELDVMEGLDGDDCWHFHSTAGGPGGCAPLAQPQGWHVFAADWAPGVVSFTYDGVKVGTIASGITSAPMFLILNLGIKSASAVVPAEMLVDYVRVSQ